MVKYELETGHESVVNIGNQYGMEFSTRNTNIFLLPQMKTDSLSARYDAVSQSHSERFSALEQAQVLVARFWETYEELEPWLGEIETLITQLPPPAIDTDALRLQQDQMRV